MRETVATAILEAAERTFSEQGVQAARMETIASSAGVAVGTLYNYFEDRTALVRELLRARRDGVLHTLDEALETVEGKPFRAQLEGVLAAMLTYFEAHRGFFAILMQGEAVKLGLSTGHPPRETMVEIFHRLEVLVHRGVKQGALRKDDAERFPGFLFGIVRTALLRDVYGKSKGKLTDEVGPLVQFFLHGAGAAK